MHRCPQRIDITQRPGDAPILLRRRVALSADHGAFLVRLEELGNAKVNEHDPAMWTQHDVGGVHVAKDDGIRFHAVQIRQHITDLDGPLNHLFFGQKARRLFQNCLQVFAGDKIHDQVAAVPLAKVIGYLGQERVVRHRQDIGFSLKATHGQVTQARIRRSVDQLLDGAELGDIRKPHVASLVDHPHATNAQNLDDLIPLLENSPLGERLPFPQRPL